VTTPPLTGGCLCSGVRLEIAEPFLDAGWCHCTRSPQRTGTPGSVQARVAPGSLPILQGELLGAYEPPDGFARAFCSACGALWSRNPHDPDQRRPAIPAVTA
jgi:hypothetical protein